MHHVHDADNTHHSLLWPHVQCFLPQHSSTDTTWFMTGVSGWKHQNVQHTKLQLESTKGTLCAQTTHSHSLISIKQVSIQKVHVHATAFPNLLLPPQHHHLQAWHHCPANLDRCDPQQWKPGVHLVTAPPVVTGGAASLDHPLHTPTNRLSHDTECNIISLHVLPLGLNKGVNRQYLRKQHVLSTGCLQRLTIEHQTAMM